MGKLNSFIKFVVFNANALLFLGGVGMIIVASLLLAADFIKLAQVCTVCMYVHPRGTVVCTYSSDALGVTRWERSGDGKER